MNKRTINTLLIIIIFIILGSFSFFMYYNYSEGKKSKKENNSVNELDNNESNETPLEQVETTIETKKEEDNKKETSKQEKSIIQSDNDTSNDQYLVATGYAGASNNAYYTKNKVLYHLTISSKEIEKIAEGVEKIESDLDTIIVHRGKDFKLIINDSYLTFVD